MKIHLLAAEKGQAMHWGSERSQLNPQPAKPLGKSEKGKPYPDLTNRKGYAWSKLILKCQFAVVFHFFWQLVLVYVFFSWFCFCGSEWNSSWSGVRCHLHFYYKQIRCGYKCANANIFLKLGPPKGPWPDWPEQGLDTRLPNPFP